MITLLKQSLNKGNTDCEVATSVLNRLKTHETQTSHHRSWGHDWVDYECHTWKQTYYESYSDWSYGPKNQQWELSRSEVNPHAELTVSSRHVTQVKHRTAKFVDPFQWRGNPVLTHFHAVQDALHKGHELPGNLVLTTDESVVQSLKQSWSAYNCDKPLSVAIATVQPAKGPSVSIWWHKGPKAGANPVRQKVLLHQLGSEPGPVPQDAKQVTFPEKTGHKLVTLRL